MSCVKVYAGIAAAASEDGESRQAALWHVLRKLDGQGAGWVKLEDLRGFCQESGYLSGRSLRRVLARGDGPWWTVNRWAGRCEYRSLARVCLRLRTRPGLSLAVPLEKLRGRGMRAVGLAGFLATRRGRPVKVATVARVTGLDARAQQRCRRHLGIGRVVNVGCQGDYERGQVMGGPVWTYKGKVYRFMANTWAVPVKALADSHARKVTRAVRGAVEQKGDGHWARLYWDDLRTARKARDKGPLSWVRRVRQYGAATVWDAI